ncbi:MAG: 4-hydroxy-tetrahydrodipicolinate reductase [Deltaproteobacteria bacterium GWA2_54_12]|nr:MAG: 4-hydroxy-tetrahydrodipicolinate reductase [Deltaproteobacteria bacterium GWA2_54_12]
MIRIAVSGAAGRMGKAIITSIDQNPATELTGALERADSPFIGKDTGELTGLGKNGVRITDSAEKALKKADVVIDFSTPEASMQLIETTVASKKAIVVGTTGFSHHQREEIKEMALRGRVVMAPNMSIGVNLLLKLVHEAARVIGNEYDMEIIEAHHRLKKDAPSGTAIRIAEVAAAAVNRDLEKVAVYERKGIIGERRPEEIGIQTIRAGDIVGDHTIIFAGPGERIELTHKASSRDTFAAGSVKAAVWLFDKPDGLYDMQDVLGLKS